MIPWCVMSKSTGSVRCWVIGIKEAIHRPWTGRVGRSVPTLARLPAERLATLRKIDVRGHLEPSGGARGKIDQRFLLRSALRDDPKQLSDSLTAIG